MTRSLMMFFGVLLVPFLIMGQSFTLTPLGVRGGLNEGNMSSYLIAPYQEKHYLCLDAGTLYSGIKTLVDDESEIKYFLQNRIKAYYISHPHFDHLSGLIINSPLDSKKPIYAPKFVIDNFKHHIFNGTSWANFGNEGTPPTLSKYQYQTTEFGTWHTIEDLGLSIQAFPLSHDGISQSSGVLIRNNTSDYFLYLGDTGADRMEQSTQLESLWKSIAPLILSKQLKGIAIECSYDNNRPNHLLFGHLTPKLLLEELTHLQKISKTRLNGLKIVITHIKPKPHIVEQLKEELNLLNPLGVEVIIAEQGKTINL
ncbi:MBL fold metallo-hydrolase [Riemerella columbina]|uniref:MBL fold metallo-hydrolase n=1 Tax=Riemerella columbina TaxID=103810 RepID=UPI00039B4E18|nr:3',5'-cyclic-nucleotide phosphodiesterase [Riemerella columbina]